MCDLLWLVVDVTKSMCGKVKIALIEGTVSSSYCCLKSIISLWWCYYLYTHGYEAE